MEMPYLHYHQKGHMDLISFIYALFVLRGRPGNLEKFDV